jgi:hypothetical protein
MFENGPAQTAEREAPSGREAGSLEEGGQRHHTKSSNQAMLCDAANGYRSEAQLIVMSYLLSGKKRALGGRRSSSSR